MRCPFCKRELDDTDKDLSVMVELDGTLMLVCDRCYERGTEAAQETPEDADDG